MKSFFLLILVLAVVGSLFYVYGVPKIFKTIYLIVRISPYEQKGTKGNILVLGDSTGYGTGSADSRNTIAGRMGADFPDYSITNISKNGRTIGELTDVLPELLGSTQYDVILIQIGGNDVLQKKDPDTAAVSLNEIFRLTNQHAKKVVMMSTGNIGAAPEFTADEGKVYEEVTRTFRKMFISLAAQNSVTYVDVFKEPAEDEFVSDPKTNTSIDGLHPTDAGYGVWYKILSPVLASILMK